MQQFVVVLGRRRFRYCLDRNALLNGLVGGVSALAAVSLAAAALAASLPAGGGIGTEAVAQAVPRSQVRLRQLLPSTTPVM